MFVDCVGFSDVFLYSEKRGTVVLISNVTLAWKIVIFKNISIKSMVANIYVQDCVEHKTRLVILNKLFKLKILSG